MSYRQRLPFLIVIDSILLIAAFLISLTLIYMAPSGIKSIMIVTSMALLFSHHLFSAWYKLYRQSWTHASIGELAIIIKVIGLSLFTSAIVQAIVLQHIHVRLLVVTALLYFISIGGARLGVRMYREHRHKRHSLGKRALIVGAGAAGTMIARQLRQNHQSELVPVGFIDDDVKKHELNILGIPVIGGVDCIESAAKELQIDHIVIAIPSLNKKELTHIYNECQKTAAKTKVLPMLEDLITGRVSVNQFRDVQVEDLLGREPVQLDVEGIANTLRGKVVLVTGAGGSIGSEICRQIATFEPRQLILLGHGENSIYAIEMDLNERFMESDIVFSSEIADLKDADKMMELMKQYRPDVVYHAAAHKHVPLMEANPDEAVKNNVIGTLNVAKAASVHHVDTFVMISTDKAVRATSIMGATKRIAEMIIQHMNSYSTTKFVTVRFGNVLGSRGSVIPLFKKQIEKGGPVTVTHPDMYRYFMTIPEASRLVIQAGALAKGGEIFVLDMGEPVNIKELAENMIRLSGHALHEIDIVYTGVRPGEKLFEQLLSESEVTDQQVHPKIYIGRCAVVNYENIEHLIRTFQQCDHEQLKQRLLALANEQSEWPALATMPG